jgi:hypothetical protein
MVPVSRPRPLDIAETVFRDLEWDCLRSEEESLVEVAFADSLITLASAFVFEEEHRFVFFLHFGPPAPRDRFPEVLELLTRANHGLVVGNWEMSLDTGEIRFRVGVDYGRDPLSKELFLAAIRSAVKAADTYQGALLAVVEGREGARDANQAAEAKRDSTPPPYRAPTNRR